MPSFKFVQKGGRIEIPTAEFHNAIVAMLNKDPVFKRGIWDAYTLSQRDKTTPRRYIEVIAHANLDEYSIFTIDKEACLSESGSASCEAIGTGTGTGFVEDMSFDLRYAKTYTKQVDVDPPGVLVTNGGQYFTRAGKYTPNIVGDEYPILVHYDGTAPLPGDEVGVVPGTYKVSKAYTGFYAISAPHTADELIWVIRVSAGGGNTLVELCLAEDHPGRGEVFNAHLGTWNSVTNGWGYDCDLPQVKAIDWRYGTPYPAEGARGYFTPWPSDDYGTIYDCVSLDCETPGDCCAGTATATASGSP